MHILLRRGIIFLADGRAVYYPKEGKMGGVNMKKTMAMLLCLILSLMMTVSAVAEGMRITVDGAEVKQVNADGDPVPEAENDLLVPLRAVLKAMGYSVNYKDGMISGGTPGDPEFLFEESESPYDIINGTTFVPYDEFQKKGLSYTAEMKEDEISYTNTYSDIEEGYYRIKLGEKYLTAPYLPEEDIVEEATDAEGAVTEKIKTPRDQVRAAALSVKEEQKDDYQLWLIKKVKDKCYELINPVTGYAVDVNDWSTDGGMKIIQYTLAGGTNQQWNFTKNSEGYELSSVHSRLPITALKEADEEKGYDKDTVIQTIDDENIVWDIVFEKEYREPTALALETEAYNELDPYLQERYHTYLFTDVDFCRSARNKAEIYLREAGFEDADKETQKKLIVDCLSITYSDLLGGSMYKKLTANYEIEGPVDKTVGEGESAKHYHSYTVKMECTSPEDIHTFVVDTVDEDDLEHVKRVADAVACYEPPIRKTLRNFYYTGDKLGTWNAWDGEVWNNTGGKTSVDGMLNMFSHELGHVIDSYFKCGDDVWRRAINKDIIPTSGYGKTNRWEDFGEFSRIYLLYRGDEKKMAALEAVYPNRTETYRAYLYNVDNEYYKEYKPMYDTVVAPIGNTEKIDGDSYATIETDGKALTNENGKLVLREKTGADNQKWQIAVNDGQCGKIYSKADGMSVSVPGVSIDTKAEVNAENAVLLGMLPDESGKYTFTVSETGYHLAVSRDEVIASNDDASSWTITPAEKIEGQGEFYIKLGDKYLAPETTDRGARLELGDYEAVWEVNKLPNGVGYITEKETGFAIDISGASTEEGAAALTYTLSRNANQMWQITVNEDNTVSFKAQHSGLYLALDENNKAIQSEKMCGWTMEEVK